MSAPRKAAFAFIFITVALDMLALGMIIPVLPKLVMSFLGGDTASASRMVGIFGTAWALMQFIAAPIVGALSDRFGRRPIVLLSNFGLGCDYLLMTFAPSLSWLFAGRLVAGVSSASISTAFAYIADVTPPEKRAERFGMLGAAVGCGVVVGPARGGLVGHWGPRVPFGFAAGLSLINGLYGLFVLPESLAPDKRAAFTWAKANWFGALRLLRSQAQLTGLALVNFIGQVAHCVLPSSFVLYATYRYHWDERMVGFTLGGVGVCMAIVQAGLVKPVVEKIGERQTLFLGVIAGAIGFAIYGIANTGEYFLIGVPIMALWGLEGPALQGLMSRRVGEDQQGQLQGANGSLQGIAGIIGPALFTTVFAQSIAKDNPSPTPGAPFLLAAGLIALSALVAWRFTRDESDLAAVTP